MEKYPFRLSATFGVSCDAHESNFFFLGGEGGGGSGSQKMGPLWTLGMYWDETRLWAVHLKEYIPVPANLQAPSPEIGLPGQSTTWSPSSVTPS